LRFAGALAHGDLAGPYLSLMRDDAHQQCAFCAIAANSRKAGVSETGFSLACFQSLVFSQALFFTEVGARFEWLYLLSPAFLDGFRGCQ
jgi:hypothetical protein